MSQSKRSSPSKCLKVRQTMFQFLKRKKKNQLQQSLKQFVDTQSKFKHDSYKSSAKKQHHSRAKSSATYDNIILDDHDTIPLFSIQRNRFTNSSNKLIQEKQRIQIEKKQIQQKLNFFKSTEDDIDREKLFLVKLGVFSIQNELHEFFISKYIRKFLFWSQLDKKTIFHGLLSR